MDNIGKYYEWIDSNGKVETQNMLVVKNLFNNSNPTKIFYLFRDMLIWKELSEAYIKFIGAYL